MGCTRPVLHYDLSAVTNAMALTRLWLEAQRAHGISQGDMPNLQKFTDKLSTLEQLRDLPLWQPEVVPGLDKLINQDVPAVMSRIGGVSPGQLDVNRSDRASGSGVFNGLLQRMGLRDRPGSGLPGSKRRRTQ